MILVKSERNISNIFAQHEESLKKELPLVDASSSSRPRQMSSNRSPLKKKNVFPEITLSSNSQTEVETVRDVSTTDMSMDGHQSSAEYSSSLREERRGSISSSFPQHSQHTDSQQAERNGPSCKRRKITHQKSTRQAEAVWETLLEDSAPAPDAGYVQGLPALHQLLDDPSLFSLVAALKEEEQLLCSQQYNHANTSGTETKSIAAYRHHVLDESLHRTNMWGNMGDINLGIKASDRYLQDEGVYLPSRVLHQLGECLSRITVGSGSGGGEQASALSRLSPILRICVSFGGPDVVLHSLAVVCLLCSFSSVFRAEVLREFELNYPEDCHLNSVKKGKFGEFPNADSIGAIIEHISARKRGRDGLPIVLHTPSPPPSLSISPLLPPSLGSKSKKASSSQGKSQGKTQKEATLLVAIGDYANRKLVTFEENDRDATSGENEERNTSSSPSSTSSTTSASTATTTTSSNSGSHFSSRGIGCRVMIVKTLTAILRDCRSPVMIYFVCKKTRLDEQLSILLSWLSSIPIGLRNRFWKQGLSDALDGVELLLHSDQYLWDLLNVDFEKNLLCKAVSFVSYCSAHAVSASTHCSETTAAGPSYSPAFASVTKVQEVLPIAIDVDSSESSKFDSHNPVLGAILRLMCTLSWSKHGVSYLEKIRYRPGVGVDSLSPADGGDGQHFSVGDFLSWSFVDIFTDIVQMILNCKHDCTRGLWRQSGGKISSGFDALPFSRDEVDVYRSVSRFTVIEDCLPCPVTMGNPSAQIYIPEYDSVVSASGRSSSLLSCPASSSSSNASRTVLSPHSRVLDQVQVPVYATPTAPSCCVDTLHTCEQVAGLLLLLASSLQDGICLRDNEQKTLFYERMWSVLDIESPPLFLHPLIGKISQLWGIICPAEAEQPSEVGEEKKKDPMEIVT